MPWTNSHLYELRAGKVGWSTPYPEQDWFGEFLDARKARLDQIIEDLGTKSMKYLYDFDDDWEHTIKIGTDNRAASGPRLPATTRGPRPLPAGRLRRPLGLWRTDRGHQEPRPRASCRAHGMDRRRLRSRSCRCRCAHRLRRSACQILVAEIPGQACTSSLSELPVWLTAEKSTRDGFRLSLEQLYACGWGECRSPHDGVPAAHLCGGGPLRSDMRDRPPRISRALRACFA
jgi:Plasmid pRiA4b ORF-3-like protein